MRFLRLDLIRIGPFAGRTLTFDQGEFGLHLIYGPNEGGKSSSLRALSQWLFGIKGEKSCRDHFLHSHNELRVGGVIESEAGQTLECIRRKGGQKSLRAGDDKTAVDLDDLHAMLHGIDEKQFATQFGIDLEQLVDGGMSIVQSGGDLGQSLFAAGSGTAGVNQLVKSLDAQCEQLLKSSGTRAAVNAAIIDLNKARKALSDASVPSKQWQAIRDSLHDSIDKRKRLDDEIVELESQRDRLDRIHQSLATISSLKDARAAYSELVDVPALRPDFSSQRAETVAALTAAKAAVQSAQSERTSIAERIDGLLVPQAILDQEAAIADLYKNLERYREWLRTCPGLESERQLLKTRIDRVLTQLGRQTGDVGSDGATADGSGADGPGNLRIGIAQRQRIVELAEQRSGLIQSAVEAKADVEEKARQLDIETQGLAALPPSVDTTQLRSAIDDAQKLGDCDQQLAEDQQRLGGLIERSGLLLKQLPLWNGTLDELESLPLPSLDSITRFASDWSSADQAIDALAGEIQTLEDSIAAAEAQLNALQLSQDVPTEEELTDARAQRDRVWQTIAANLSRPPATVDASDSADQFETLLRRADDIGDRLRREAERVAQKSRLISDRDGWTQTLETRRARLDAARCNRQNLVDDWKSLWMLANIDPRSPLEMREWLASHGQLVELADAIRNQTLIRDQTCERIQQHRTTLWKRYSETFPIDSRDLDINDVDPASGSNGDSAVGSDDPLRQVIDRCATRCKLLDSISTKHEQLSARIDQIRSQQAASQARWDDANAKQARWQQEWSVAVDALDGSADLTAAQALAMLQAIDQVAADIDKSAELANTWSNQRRLIEEFEASVDQLLQRLDVSPSETPKDQTVADLHVQLRHAREQKATRDGLVVQRDRVEQQLSDALQSQSKLAEMLDQMRREAGCDSVDDLPEVERRSAERGRIEQQIDSLEKQLRQSAQGTEIDAFIAAADAEDADRLVPRMAQLDEEIQRVKVEQKDRSESIGGQQKDLDRMDGSGDAAKANEDAEIALAQVRQHAETYTRVKLASVVLKRAIQRYREQNQGPLIDRASQLFAKLTLGAFDGLRSDFGDDGQPIIVGVRGTGGANSEADSSQPALTGGPSLVPVDGMSEGTCDQMFLALRIASLEQYFEHHPPVPFVVDDILVKFDDARSAAAMEVLAELSVKTQVIVFTHHQHLIDVARGSVPADRLFVQSLEDASPYRQTSQASSGTSAKVAAKASPKKKSKPAKKKSAAPAKVASVPDSQQDGSAKNSGELF
ncbi:hypothetical protein K227x_33110 [Rubripirellula lacrimiformis]|uniref:YhaN AAA domain-containing protein n=1 Tax=Rubripirellula lacrimiformis TaxID=1930273 RepID=A0A517NCR0_9BACT|nr:YhaN family protein [Rubripirellula lacrimiformis]QDT04913.1 hypothetical protein K227x_33110 [Rubripirellula lacrimiformis]